MSTTAPSSPDDDTVIVDRDDTVVVVRPGVVLDPEDTVLVEHSDAEAADRDDTVPVDRDETVSIDRDDTMPVDRDDTVIVPRSGEEEAVDAPPQEPTARIDRGASDSRTQPVDVAGSIPVRPAMVPATKRRRGELRPAPVRSGFGGVPLAGSGAGAVSSYGVRVIGAPPVVGIASGSHAPLRAVGGVESVERRSRRAAAATIAVFAGSFLVFAGGLLWAVAALVGF